MPTANCTYPQAGFRCSLDRKSEKVKYLYVESFLIKPRLRVAAER
jgi:hypothetical protein